MREQRSAPALLQTAGGVFTATQLEMTMTTVAQDPRPTKAAVLLCACGRAYSLEEWRELELVDTNVDDGAGGLLELRHCVCGSTRAIQLPDPSTVTLHPSSAGGDEDLAELLEETLRRVLYRRLDGRRATIERLRRERDRYRHESAPRLDAELGSALLAFYDDANALFSRTGTEVGHG